MQCARTMCVRIRANLYLSGADGEKRKLDCVGYARMYEADRAARLKKLKARASKKKHPSSTRTITTSQSGIEALPTTSPAPAKPRG